MTVEADLVSVESRLSNRQIDCPVCPGVLGPWGWARRRRVHGLASVRPRRARCVDCLVTHVLLPVTMLVRRGWAATIVWSALVLRGRGWGHRRIAVAVGVSADTVRGWLRRMTGRLEAVRAVFIAAAGAAGIDQPAAVGAGGPWRDMLAAVGAAMAAITARFGPAGLLGEVTATGVAVACSTGRLLSPDWPGGNGSGFATRFTSAGITR